VVLKAHCGDKAKQRAWGYRGTTKFKSVNDKGRSRTGGNCFGAVLVRGVEKEKESERW